MSAMRTSWTIDNRGKKILWLRGVEGDERAALLEEMSTRVFVVYRQCIAFLLIAPFAFLSSVTVNQNLYYEGLYLSSSSVSSALSNLIPAITFVMAYILGLEKVHIRSLRSIAKIIGTMLSVSGAVVHATACYPDHLSLAAWICLMAAVQSGILALIVEPNTKMWKLTSPLQLLSCFYAGLTSAVTYFAQAWCIARRGPLFSAMFNPLGTVIVTILACILLHEELYTGSMIGGLAVIIGLYIVLWGKAKDHQHTNNETTSLDDQTTSISDCRIDLEEPLLREKSANCGCDNIEG
ncbi:hypothetical protein DH2020_014125 [Rehmannia glutinosa]|uniref:WAT1-related protein n=1 Tax=Rehmannia glutinosa TaxID=99300 RepID=A0ABR0WW95_REHGL